MDRSRFCRMCGSELMEQAVGRLTCLDPVFHERLRRLMTGSDLEPKTIQGSRVDECSAVGLEEKRRKQQSAIASQIVRPKTSAELLPQFQGSFSHTCRRS